MEDPLQLQVQVQVDLGSDERRDNGEEDSEELRPNLRLKPWEEDGEVEEGWLSLKVRLKPWVEEVGVEEVLEVLRLNLRLRQLDLEEDGVEEEEHWRKKIVRSFLKNLADKKDKVG